MGRLEVLNESLPDRCEVCHQSDLYDPVLDLCRRCTGVALPAIVLSPPSLLGSLLCRIGLHSWVYLRWDRYCGRCYCTQHVRRVYSSFIEWGEYSKESHLPLLKRKCSACERITLSIHPPTILEYCPFCGTHYK